MFTEYTEIFRFVIRKDREKYALKEKKTINHTKQY